ncbi:MAG TPA: DUF2332 domain-containing protein [Bryobacteraceae bacterium]|nr:DUF2332 domain-containing protein [Bryobacteraceae bacterium]
MDAQKLAAAIREQAQWCQRLGSPLYHSLLERMATDVESSGVVWKVLQPFSGDPGRSLLPLRFLAGLHRLALEGCLPDLARCYPSAGGSANPEAAFAALLNALEHNAGQVRDNLPPGVQTNEVSRCAALLPGFLEIGRSTGLPLRLLEIGCSAGLNLRWDHYRYDTSRGPLGDPNSPVVFDSPFVGDPPANVPVAVVERRGCDLNPIDPTTGEGRLTLLSFVWPDQTARFQLLAKAIEMARIVPSTLDRANAVEWLEAQLARPRNGAATVVFHSIVLLYLSNGDRQRVEQLLARAGEQATKDAPLAWLSMEPGEDQTDVRLTLWPSGERKRIATAGYHGRPVSLL